MSRIPRLSMILGVFGGLSALIAFFLVLRPLSRASASPETLPPLVFVARAHLATEDDIFRDELGPAGQFGTGLTKFAPGSKLVRRVPDGSLFVYNTPGLVDVQSPDVNFDASRIVFAGATTLIPGTEDSGWRLYEINVDGTGFQPLTTSDRTITIPSAGLYGNQETYGTYSDLFPAYLADGRIVFASSRYPTRAHYDGRRTFNLYVMDGDGSDLRRITTERGGLLHPTPLPDGRILASRWWNQFNQPSETGVYNRIDNAEFDHLLPDGTLVWANPDHPFNPALGVLPGGYPIRDAPNTWHLMTLNPDGTDFRRLAWTPRYHWALDDDSGFYDTYAAAQPAPLLVGEELYIAYTAQTDSTMVHSTLKSGIRVARPEVLMMYANTVDALAGLTYDRAWGEGDDSGPYALHPWGLPDGSVLFSLSEEDSGLPASGSYTEGAHTFDLQGSNLRYRLYTMSLDGGALSSVPLDLAGIGYPHHDAMDAKPIVARTGWTALSDTFSQVPLDDPAYWNVPNSLPEYPFSQLGPGQILTATIHNPNVYANPPLELPFVNNSPPPGSVAFAQLWIDANQFTGAYCYNDWPDPCDDYRADNQLRAVLWDEVPVTQAGAFTMTVPADTMGFIVLRDSLHRVVRGWNRGYISIAQGSAWARPGETVTCVGCHMGHVSGSIDSVEAQAESGWTNVAPYAVVEASSHYDYHDPDNPEYRPFRPPAVVDRRGWVPLPAGGPPVPDEAVSLSPAETPVHFDSPVSLLDSGMIVENGDVYQDDETGWISSLGRSAGEWVELTWSANQRVRSILLAGPPPRGGDWGGFGEPDTYGDYYVEAGTLSLYRDGVLVEQVPVGRVEPLETGGTEVVLPTPLVIDRLRLTIDATSGRWWWDEVAALNEIEVIGQAAESWPLLEVRELFMPTIVR